MKKRVLGYCLLVLCLTGYIFAKASDGTTYSAKFIKNFKDCSTYQENYSSEYEGEKFNEKREILGWKNGFCHYRTTVNSSNSAYKLDCMFSDIQVEEIYKAMKNNSKALEDYNLDIMIPTKETKNGQPVYKKIGSTVIKGTKAYITWTKYENNPYFCHPQKL